MLALGIVLMLQSATPAGAAAVTQNAAVKLVDGFSQAERQSGCAEFDDPRRTAWNYLPGERFGVRLDELDEGSRLDLDALLRSVLSTKGIAKVEGIYALEAFLGKSQPERYNEGAYKLAFFGTPSGPNSWGFRLEGHHLSLNFTAPTNAFVVTPMFMGSAPFQVPSGARAGDRPLGEERDLAFALLRSLTPEQKRKAILGTNVPADIITNPATTKMDSPMGIAFADMTVDQQKRGSALLRVFADRLRGDFADAEMKRMTDAGIAQMHFAWIGADDETKPHYYRLQGPTTIIEFDCTSGTADHVHTIWRDPANDFATNILRAHLQEEKHSHAPSSVPTPVPVPTPASATK